ncbi:MAG TPA: alpha/beta fold hydrolase [Vicinamibacterales bacterium]|nr:alpha/beta fold hydrolase [Vicinamibacterales bacterium]
MLFRALLSFLALPGIVAFVVPVLVAWPRVRAGSFNAIALVLLIPGITLLIWCVRDFLVTGKGTLAPWDPPRRLVSAGPYRWSRNPMYVGVALILLGWSIAFGSWSLLLYALIVAIAFHLRVVLGEEPWLARTHGRAWTEYVARVPRWFFPNRRALLLSCLGLVIAVFIGGLLFEAYADAQAVREFLPPGKMVDIGGRRLHLVCIGKGEPTVLFEASGWGNALSSSKARERLANRTMVCSYDRRGRGWSDSAPGVTTIAALTADLGVLQDRAKLQWPVVIVASSIGGLTAEMFARTYPERVAGLVFVDAANSLIVPRLTSQSGTITALACAAGAMAQFGVIRLLDPFALGDDSEGARRSAAITHGARPWAETCATARGLTAIQREFAQAPPLPADIPLIALSASSTKQLMPPFAERFVDAGALSAELEDTHRVLAKQSSRGTWKKVPDSTHLIGDSQPDAVADAVFDVLEQLRRE